MLAARAQPGRSIPTRCSAARRSLKLIDPALRDDREANRLFMEILTSQNDPEAVLGA